MRIDVLCENNPFKNKFEAEHGLSLLIHTGNHKILFDVGQSDVFLKNASRLGESLEDVDIVVLSHGHYDHCNGLFFLLEQNETAKIYLHERALGEFYHGDRYIGIASDSKSLKDRFVFFDEEIIIDNIVLSPAASLPRPISSSFLECVGGELYPDWFEHEIYLTICEAERKVLFTGCGHRGISVIAEKAARDGVTDIVGGFHLTDDLSEEELRKCVNHLSSLPLAYYSGHCTCGKALELLHGSMGNRFSRLSSGLQFAIGTKSEVASALFRQGYNCSQAVFGAFAEELGLPLDTAMKVACSFGGGMGRMREICGAVSGMLLVCGLAKGYATPETGELKAEHYRLVQRVAKEFKERHGSLYCRELLGGVASDLPTPTARTPEFYQKRPCERLIASAAAIVEEMILGK